MSSVITGKWRWELQQRHQHLVREYASSGQDTAELDAAYEACVAAALQEKQQQQQDSEGQDLYARIVGGEETVLALLHCHFVTLHVMCCYCCSYSFVLHNHSTNACIVLC